MCSAGRLHDYGEVSPCNRQASTVRDGAPWCAKHDPQRLAEIRYRDRPKHPALRNVSTHDLRAELARRERK
jgi:hypothetical protein